jgi:GNAT superfamily N-acetyltransferase
VIIEIKRTQDVAWVIPLAQQWRAECNADTFGLDTYQAETILGELQSWLDERPGVLLVALDGEKPVGFFAVFAVKSFLGEQNIALEKYWYALPNYSLAGVRLFRAAQQWAEEQGCSHLIVAASNLASEKHDKVCRFCQDMGMQLFETAYIQEVSNGHV